VRAFLLFLQVTLASQLAPSIAATAAKNAPESGRTERESVHV